MKFCRNCGSPLAAPGIGTPVNVGAPMHSPAYGVPVNGPPMGAPMGAMPGGPPPPMPPPMGAAPMGGPAMPPPGPLGGVPSGPLGGPGSGPARPPGMPMSGPLVAGPLPVPGGPMPPTLPPSINSANPSTAQQIANSRTSTVPATMAPDTPIPPEVLAAAAARAGQTVICPRCSTKTPIGFAYCQQCGMHLAQVASAAPPPTGMPTPTPNPGMTDPSGPPPGMRIRPPTSPQIPPRPSAVGAIANPGIDQHGATIATDTRSPLAAIAATPVASPLAAPGPMSAPRPAAPAPAPMTGPTWGTAVLVNRDGSDGQRFPLGGEYIVIGRSGADIAFDDDRFLARQHARLERGGDGVVRIAPLDTLNGVFRKTDAPVELVDGMMILVGREVLRYERVDPEEAKMHPLVRHGVALFGSPPREPWGRVLQIVPSGGYRDVRHLVGEEVVLGREEGDIVFRDDAFMSRRHAALTWDGKRGAITDLGSSNGTFVRVTVPTPLKHGDHVRMGDQLLRVELGR